MGSLAVGLWGSRPQVSMRTPRHKWATALLRGTKMLGHVMAAGARCDLISALGRPAPGTFSSRG